MSIQKRKIIELNIAVFAGAWDSPCDLNFSKLNLRFIQLDSEDYKIITETNNILNPIGKAINDLIEDEERKFKYLLLPINLEDEVAKEQFWLVRNILKIISPSEINIVHEIRFQVIDKTTRFSGSSSYQFQFLDYDDYFELLERDIVNCNLFINSYLDRFQNISFLKPLVQAYIESFFHNFDTMKFLSLCMALETFVNGKNELTYRIRRNTSVLISPTKDLGQNVYKNIKKIYDLRSKIVHGSNYNTTLLKDYTYYLRNVVSRIIIEIIGHNISGIDNLNNQLTYIGFGYKANLSEGYEENKVNISVYHRALREL